MIHLDLSDGSSVWLTEEQFEQQYPELYEALRKPAPWQNYGRRLKYLRVKENMTVREVAQLLCISMAEVSAIEAGKQEATADQVGVYQMLKFKQGLNHG